MGDEGITLVLQYLVFPLILGSTMGSLYFLVSYQSSEQEVSWIPLAVLFLVSFFFGYSAGMIVVETAWAMFVALFSSAIAVELLDATARSIRRDEEPPKILTWVVEVIKGLRGSGGGRDGGN